MCRVNNCWCRHACLHRNGMWPSRQQLGRIPKVEFGPFSSPELSCVSWLISRIRSEPASLVQTSCSELLEIWAEPDQPRLRRFAGGVFRGDQTFSRFTSNVTERRGSGGRSLDRTLILLCAKVCLFLVLKAITCVCVFCRRVLSYQNLRTRRSFNVDGGEHCFSSTPSSSFKPTQPVWVLHQRQTLSTHYFSSPHADLTGLPVAFYFNTSELPLSKLKPRLLPPDSCLTQMRQ